MSRTTRFLVGACLLAVALAALMTTLLLAHHGRGARTAPASPLARPFVPDGTQLSACDHVAALAVTACRGQALGNVAYRNGADAAFATLAGAVRAQGGTWPADAHIVQHRIGSAVLARTHGDVGQALAQGARGLDSPGSGGYLHGVLLVSLAHTPRAQLAARAAALCDAPSVRGNGSATYWCLHGVGHALMIFSSDDLPYALRGCDTLPGANRDSCLSGAFMENLSGYSLMMRGSGVHSRYVRANDMLYPCNWVAQRYRTVCYLQVRSRILPFIHGDFRRIVPICRAAGTSDAPTCFRSFGNLAFDWSQGDMAKMRRLCADLQEGAVPCIESLTQALAANGDRTGRSAARLCGTLRGVQQLACTTSLGQQLATRGDRATSCAALLRGALAHDCAVGIAPGD